MPSTLLILNAFVNIRLQQRAIFGAPPKLRLLVRGYFHRQRLLALIQSIFSEAALGAYGAIQDHLSCHRGLPGLLII